MSATSLKTAVRIPVAIAPGAPAKYEVAADLHQPVDGGSAAIQVLLSGGLYNRHHWDFPYRPERYSYARYMTAAGWTCLALDRIGNGDSSRPPSGEVDCVSSAYVVHQVVQALRKGQIGSRCYERVVLVGHSTGSAVAAIEANTYLDVDGLLLTGWGHGIPDLKRFEGWSWHMPAREDPKFSGLGLDEGYITIRAGAMGKAFYNVKATEPQVLELEEQLKDTYCVKEGATLHLSFETQKFRKPVLIANGMLDPYPFSKDRLMARNSAAFGAFELPYWHEDVDLQTLVIPNQAHVLNNTAGTLFFSYALAWMNAFIGLECAAARSTPEQLDEYGLRDVSASERQGL